MQKRTIGGGHPYRADKKGKGEMIVIFIGLCIILSFLLVILYGYPTGITETLLGIGLTISAVLIVAKGIEHENNRRC